MLNAFLPVRGRSSWLIASIGGRAEAPACIARVPLDSRGVLGKLVLAVLYSFEGREGERAREFIKERWALRNNREPIVSQEDLGGGTNFAKWGRENEGGRYACTNLWGGGGV